MGEIQVTRKIDIYHRFLFRKDEEVATTAFSNEYHDRRTRSRVARSGVALRVSRHLRHGFPKFPLLLELSI